MDALQWFWLFIVSYALWVIAACVSLLLERRSPTATLAWIFAFVAIPIFSGIYYLMFGPRRLHRRRRRYSVARRSVSRKVSGADDGPARPQLNPDAAGLAAVARRLEQGEATFASAVTLLDDGDATLKALEEKILESRHHIHFEYYIWEPDGVGTHFRDLLADAAKRGVEVRVLYDAMGSPNVNRRFWAPLCEAGGEVIAFNPVHLLRITFGNFRTHRKIAICDGLAGFLGGINMHEPASATRSGKNAWRDQHVRIDGEPVHRIQRLFLENWNYSRGEFKLNAANVEKYFPPARIGKGIPVQIIASGPDDTTAPMHAFFLACFSTARRRILIETPYLIPDEPMESALRIADLRGVDVQVIVPKQGDSKLVTAASNTYCESMRKAGIKLFEYGPPMLHAKTIVIDDTVGIVGTANIDNRSFRLNFEVAAAFYDRNTIERLAKRFEIDRAASRAFPAKRRPEMVTALFESIARLTSPVL
ncbi:MAG TPA: cardiolipin synthase [Usitatibacter sp.]|nr:cardiolipin synthase [Usitatibacter sp.]